MQSNTAEKYILYAGDKWNDHEWVKEKLRHVHSGLEVITVSNGLEVIQYISSLRGDEYYPSLIILDINMPVWDGIRTLSTLKKEGDWRGIPVIMLATATQQKDAELSIKLGADRCITKPFKEDDLKSVLENLAGFSLKQPARKIIVAW
jgi:CheY-like chemotaxis protein